MLDRLELKLMKESVDGENIIYLNIDGKEFVFRTLGVGEYIDIKECIMNEKDIEDVICQTTKIYPYDDIRFGEYEFAGISSIASKEILFHSGLSGDPNSLNFIKQVLNEKREEMYIYHNHCINIVKAAFQELSLKEIRGYSWFKLVDLVARAESVLTLRGVDVMIVDSNVEDEGELETFVDKEEKKPTIKEYLENGVDPMMYFSKDILEFVDSRDVIEAPFIGGIHWDREEVVNAISEQF